jgi:hypothetical protein
MRGQLMLDFPGQPLLHPGCATELQSMVQKPCWAVSRVTVQLGEPPAWGIPHMLGLKNQAKGPSIAVPGRPRPPTSSQFIAVRFDLVHTGGHLIRMPYVYMQMHAALGFAGPHGSAPSTTHQLLGPSHTAADRPPVWHHLIQGCSACSSPCADWCTAGCCWLPRAQGACGASQLGLAQSRSHRGHGCWAVREDAGQTQNSPATRQRLAHPECLVKYWQRSFSITG